jgi:hypothetical protein
MKIDEYGSIQQHLEPVHIRQLLIPIPDDMNKINKIIDLAKKAISIEQMAHQADSDASKRIDELLSGFDIL